MARAEHPRARAIVAGARACVGYAFRPQGRGNGCLDCLGVVLAAAAAAGLRLDARRDYALGSCDCDELLRGFRAQGLRQLTLGEGVAGDVVLAVPAPGQLHLAILTDVGLVEAHVGLRKVIERPLKPGDAWHSAWRLPLGDE